MQSSNNLRNVALALGLAAAAMELYFAVMTMYEVGRAADHRGGGLVYAVPLIMAAGALLIRFYREAYVGAGVLLVAMAIQHIMMDIRAPHYIAIALGGAAVAIGVMLDVRSREEASKA